MRKLLVLAILPALILAACGGEEATPTSTPAPTATATRTPTPTPVATATSIVTATPPAIDAAALYGQYCAACHGPDRKGGVGPDITAAGLQARGTTDQVMKDTITNGGATLMPAWKDRLSADQIEALAKYLKT